MSRKNAQKPNYSKFSLGERVTFSDIILTPQPEYFQLLKRTMDKTGYENLSEVEKEVYRTIDYETDPSLFDRVSRVKGGFWVVYSVIPMNPLEFELNPGNTINRILKAKGYLCEAVSVCQEKNLELDPTFFTFLIYPESDVDFKYNAKRYNDFRLWNDLMVKKSKNIEFEGKDVVPALIDFLKQNIKV